MMERLFTIPDRFFIICFRVHDVVSAFFGRHLFGIKRALLVVAHLSLLGFLFPDMRKAFGEMAANLLLIILFLSPLSRIFRIRLLAQLMAIRRELGILMAYMATVHGLGYVLDPEWLSVFIAPFFGQDVFAIEARLMFGMGAYLLTLPLLLTSNTLATRFLGGKRWKQLHRLVYGVFFLVIFHRLLTKIASGDDVVALIEAGILIGSYLFAQVLARKNVIGPLRSAITAVALRYDRYTLMRKDEMSIHTQSQ